MANGELPQPCPKCQPLSGNWQLTAGGLARCDCARGKALRALSASAPGRPPVLSEKAARNAIGALAALPYFPGKDEAAARTLIANELMAICHSVPDLRWLVTRMLRLYSAWPGMREMRIVYSQKQRPLDGYDMASTMSQFYPEGIPSELPAPEPILAALPPGHQFSADPQIEAAVHTLGHGKVMPAGFPRDERFGQKLLEARAERAKLQSRDEAARREISGEIA